MNKKSSYIGKFRPDDGRDIFDQSYNRQSQDFIMRVEEGECFLASIETSPKLPENIRKIIRQAITMSYREGLPWRGIINNVQIQIYEKLEF